MSSTSRQRSIPWGAASLAGIVVVAAIALAVVAFRGSGPSGNLQDRVRSVASTLRCPVCQNLSVADSPSRLANQMRATIGQELQSGRTPAQIREEFALAYGEWILLAPPKHGIEMTVWLAPLVLLMGGVAISVVAVRRWTAGASPEPSTGVDDEPAMSDADRNLLERALASAPEEPE
jgi:cytochrome c-type biogenesis protein CcmH